MVQLMKEIYETPTMQIIELDSDDIILTSPIIEEDEEDWSEWYD